MNTKLTRGWAVVITHSKMRPAYCKSVLIDLSHPSLISIKNRCKGEVGGGTLYHKVYLSRLGADTMLGTVILLYRCMLFQPLFTCTHLQLFALHSKATWRQPGLSFVNETSQFYNTTNESWL